jgi:hypothetical protein
MSSIDLKHNMTIMVKAVQIKDKTKKKMFLVIK